MTTTGKGCWSVARTVVYNHVIAKVWQHHHRTHHILTSRSPAKPSVDDSPFDKYCRELASGLLEWGSIHTAAFWKASAVRFEARDFAMLKSVQGRETEGCANV